MVSAPISKSVSEFKKGAITGNASGIRSYAGKQVGDGIRAIWKRNIPKNIADQNASSLATAGYGGYKTSGFVGRQSMSNFQKMSPEPSSPSTISSQSVPQQITSTGYDVSQKQTMKINQTGYSVENKKTGVTTTYLTQNDAKADGYGRSQLKKTTVDGNYLNLTHPSSTTTPGKIQELLKERTKLQQENASRILIKSKARKSDDQIIRIYTKEDK